MERAAAGGEDLQAADSGPSSRRRWLALAVVAAGMWLSVLNVTIVNIALPDIARDMDVDVSAVGWVVTGFLLVQATLLPIAGRAGDLYGRRRVFVVGALVLGAASLLCAVAWSVGSLIAFRVIQAVGACAMAPTAYSYVGTLFGARERGQAMGVLTGAIGLAPVVALNLAGVLVGAFGWRSVFLFSPVIVVLVLVGAALYLPELARDTRRVPFDLPGAALAALGLGGVLLALSQGENWGFSSRRVLGAAGLGVVCLVGFGWWERRAAEPLVPPALLRLRSLVTANAAAGAGAAAMFGLLVLLPFYMVRVLGFGPRTVAAAMTPVALAFLVFGPVGGRLMGRVGSARLAVGGYAGSTVGAALLAVGAASESYLAMLPGLALFATGLALAQSPVTTTAISEAPRDRLGVASSMPNISRYAGGALGTTLLGAIMHAAAPVGAAAGAGRGDAAVRADVASGMRAAGFVAALFMLVALAVATRMPRPGPRRTGREVTP